jgi:hypothetical protein
VLELERELERELEPLLNLRVLIFARDSNPAVFVIRGGRRFIEIVFGRSDSYAATNAAEIRERARCWEIVTRKPPVIH